MNTKSYFCHNSIYDGSYLYLSLSLLSRIYNSKLKAILHWRSDIFNTLLWCQKGLYCVWYAMSVFIYINEGKIDGILHGSILWRITLFCCIWVLKLAKEKSGNHGPYHAECVVLGHPSSTSSFSLLDPLVRWPYTAADISESYQTTKPLRFRDAILIIYKHEN